MMKLNDAEKKGIIMLLTEYFDGKKTHLAGVVIILSAIAWIGSYVLSAYGAINPILAEGIRNIVEFAGWLGGGLGAVFLRMALSKSK